jgi:predicted transport protein
VPLFRSESKDKLKGLKEISFHSEADIQSLTEKNLDTVFGLEYVASEYEPYDLRLDTLAFDGDSFVIIEYKKAQNISVIDQGIAYLNELLEHKGDFVLTYNSKTGKSLQVKDVDWKQPKVIFVSPAFTKFQKLTAGSELPIELWEIHKFDGGLVLYDQIEAAPGKGSFLSLGKKGGIVTKVASQVTVYTEEHHKEKGSPEMNELYDELRSRLIKLGDDITIQPKKFYIGFKRKTNFADVEIQKSKLRVSLNADWGKLKDPENISENVSKKGHWGNGDYQIDIRDASTLDQLMPLARQSYELQP